MAHLHITEIEHEHLGVRVTADNDEVDPAHPTCINPGGFLELPSRLNHCKNHTPRTPSTTSSSGLLEPYDSSESSIGSSIVVHSAVRESPRPSNGCHKPGDESLEIRTGYDGELERKPGGKKLNEINAREKEGEQRIKIRDSSRSAGRSKRPASDYLGEC